MGRRTPEAAWRDFFAELDSWAPGRATFWWRDDDAVKPRPRLERLLGLGTQPVAVAVIPAAVRPMLALTLNAERIDVLQHGFNHDNHEPSGKDEAEFGPARPTSEMLAELRRGRQWLVDIFGSRFLPVLVPPWNNISPDLLGRLADEGYRGVSTIDARPFGAGPFQTNVHADVVDWQWRTPLLGLPRPGFRGTVRILAAITDHLAARRRGEADPGEATGLLTHHIQMNEDCFRFVEEFLSRSAAHPAVSWLAAREIFPAGRA